MRVPQIIIFHAALNWKTYGKQQFYTQLDALPHCPSRGPIFHRGAPRCHWGATPVTGVHWADHEIGRGAPQPTRNAKFGRGWNLSSKIWLGCTPSAWKRVVSISIYVTLPCRVANYHPIKFVGEFWSECRIYNSGSISEVKAFRLSGYAPSASGWRDMNITSSIINIKAKMFGRFLVARNFYLCSWEETHSILPWGEMRFSRNPNSLGSPLCSIMLNWLGSPEDTQCLEVMSLMLSAIASTLAKVLLA